jgi:starvation-inducible DNA-binding protein
MPRRQARGNRSASAFAGALAEFGSRMRKAIDQTDELGDKDSADICTGISRGIDKWLWVVEAHVQAPVQHGVRR